jgi:hypothetical protein
VNTRQPWIADARAAAWGAVMTAGQPGSPGNMPQPETSTPWLGDRQASAFAARMTAGAKLEDSHAGCGGCSDDAPCEHCGTPRSDPTHQRAEWADFVAASRQPPSEFWRTAIMADAFFGSDVGGGTPDSNSPIAQGMEVRRHVASAMSSLTGQWGVEFALDISRFSDRGENDESAGAGLRAPRLRDPQPVITPGTDPGEDFISGPPSSPVKQPDPTTKWEPRAACCCRAKDIRRISPPLRSVDGAGVTSNPFTIVFVLEPGLTSKSDGLACTFTWEEYTTVTYGFVTAGTWWDLTDHPELLNMGGFVKATPTSKASSKVLDDLKSKTCPTDGEITEPLNDSPGAHEPRILIIRVTLKSGCDSSTKVKYIIQEIGPNKDAAGNWDARLRFSDDPTGVLTYFHDSAAIPHEKYEK